ncbi:MULTISPECIES: alpha/beta hydrolase [Streptomyces]|uniref:Alpha/beta hydrolase n=1 Tax=Streptomyces lycii TaxID=2654337 RepID=A0ABQ7FDU3_9ACTN|nr:alpha/beta hydrolase [Streptomyces lycii]KAF4405844.1 alpha/beta hydrolase [Streptomyces lycii]
MDLTRIPAEPDPATAHAAVAEVFGGIGSRSLALPEGADPAPVLPETGGVPGAWVTAEGVRASAEAGVVLYVHGGGFGSRMPELISLMAHRLSRATSRPVFAVHYRLAPAHPYPEPLDDVVAVYGALLGQGVPAERIAVVGESSGGALTLSALLRFKESGTALPATVVTLSPVTDLTVSGPSVDSEATNDPGVDRAVLTHLIGQYLGGARPDRAPQSPVHGALDGLPPLLMVAGGAEALLDDTLRYAEAASAAGTKVAVEVYEGMPHAFHITALDDDNPTGRTVLRRTADWIAAH